MPQGPEIETSNAVGQSVVDVEKSDGVWWIVKRDSYNRVYWVSRSYYATKKEANSVRADFADYGRDA